MKHASKILIEITIAIIIIVVITASLTLLMRVSAQENGDIEKKLIALNLAEEGLAALENIRDTNYLRFPSDPDNCWNKLNVTDVSECSNGTAGEITDGETYYLDQSFFEDPLFEWRLKKFTDPTAHGVLDLYTIDLDGDREEDTQLYIQTGVNLTGFSVERSDAFRRQIDIEYDGGGYYIATVTVTWDDQGTRKSAPLTRTIAHVY